MKFINPQKENFTITSAIFFSLLIHFAAGVILLFGLSTNLSTSPELKGIKLVWISFDDKKEFRKLEIKNNISYQPPQVIKKINEKPANIATTVHNPESIQMSSLTTTSLAVTNPPEKNVTSDMEFKEKSYNINGYSIGKTTDKSSNLNTVIAYPLYKENSPPVYPEIARVRGYEGIVLVFAEILPSGRVGEVKIRKSSGYAILDQSAVKAVKPWKFEPAKKSGSPFTAWVELPIKFILNNNSRS
jgi:TonB family protein